jgi:ribosomal protein L37AE/L43A
MMSWSGEPKDADVRQRKYVCERCKKIIMRKDNLVMWRGHSYCAKCAEIVNAR